MNNPSCSKSKQNEDFEDDEIFDDSSFLAKFDNSFKPTPKPSESNINDSSNKSALNVSALCCDEELNGYDKLTGKTWIYPTNYPVRDYQFNIIRAAILKNTLVSLPTGLGKTFIAAVIMYNFYRWYPLGKIVFTAPTRPLVAQQIEACYNIIAIPPSDTIEMTGHMQANTRKAHWHNKRVFFATPQVIYNDIKSGICPCDKIRCLVIDEAHRARGNYAYCQIVSSLDHVGHKIYRLLALSATPGSKVEDVINVVKNLHIAHLELRTEGCIDVAPYSHARNISTVIIQLGPELTQLRQQYVEILDWYARRLKQFNILPQNLGNLSKGRIVMLYKEFQNKERGARHPQHNYIMKDFTVLIALYHGLELLAQHGSRVFLNFFDEHPEKSWIQADDRLTALLERLRDDLGINPLSLDRSILPDGTVPEMPKDLCFGHPKFDKLKELMMDHFTKAKNNKQDTRAIVFCEYRESVNLVHCLLLQCRPLIKPQMFVGQGASGKDGKTVVSQKQQLRVMRAFREGACNTLVATCVAEEGLDVGSVDLILCFDISTRSPIRLVQRCGRTGRERGGQVYILVTEGREHQTLMDCMRQRDGLNKKIQQSKEVASNLYKANPRMVPRDFTPQCQKMFITVQKKQDPKEKSRENKVKKGQKDLRSMLLGRASSSSSSASNKDSGSAALITEDEFKELYPEGYKSTKYFGQQREYWAMNKEAIMRTIDTEEQSALKLSTWLEWQRTLQKTVNIGHTRDTEIMSELLQYTDAKRFEMPPSTQNPSFDTQVIPTQKVMFSSPAKTKPLKKKQKVPATKSPVKRDGDIRALFSTATKSTKSYTKLINDLGIQNDGNIPTRLISLLVDLTLDNTAAVRKCYICQNICECSLIENVRKHKPQPILLTSLSQLKLPDIDLIDDFDANSILKFAEGKNKPEEIFDEDKSMEVDNKNCTGNFDLEFDFGSPTDFNTPVDEAKNESISMESDKNFEIGDIEDIFADSSPEEAIEHEVKEEKPTDKVALEFFGLDSIEDIFADDDVIELTPDEIPDPTNKSDIKHSETNAGKSSNKEHQLSPSILSGRPKNIDPTSPILCSQGRKFQLTTKKDRPQSSTPFSSVKRQLIKKESQNKFSTEARNDKSSLMKTSVADISNKSMFTITQLVEMINKSDNEKSVTKAAHNQIEVNEDRSTSPILLTQADRKKTAKLNNPNKITTPVETNKKTESLIILDSDSDSDSTQIYDPEEIHQTEIKTMISPINCKRKLDMEDSDTITASPYFCKKQKLDNQESKQLSLQEKVLAAISSTKINKNNNDCNNEKAVMNFSVTQPSFLSQKENRQPTNVDEGRNKLEMLQIFRRDSKLDIRSNSIFNKSPQKAEVPQKRKLAFDDSDDDFVIEGKNGYKNQKTEVNGVKDKSMTNHKVRKKKNKKVNEFLDMEAALSDDDDNSGDELSDDSVGSIADFICDENVTHHEDIQAVYLKSIKSPIKGGAFKIPELPKKFNREDILSQYVEDDTYEMDSFCVDSHIGLTQVNDVSELELAEIVLEEERRAKKSRRINSQSDDSPVVKRNKPKKRQIDSDSDDSS